MALMSVGSYRCYLWDLQQGYVEQPEAFVDLETEEPGPKLMTGQKNTAPV